MMIKVASLLVLSLFHTVTIVAAVASNKTVTYDPGELLAKIFKPNITVESRQRGYGFVKFEDQPDLGVDPDTQGPGQYGLIDFERDQRPLRFEDNDYDSQDYDPYTPGSGQLSNSNNRPLKFEDSEQNQDLAFNSGGVNFQDDNNVDHDQGNKKKRKRRRRRKPKNGVLPYYQGAPQLTPGRPELQGPLQGGYGLSPYGNLAYPGSQPFRRPRRPRPRPSLATEALSSVTEALTSIARYDDYECVPRLLCEAAGGGSLSDNGVLQSIAGIQPLLTLLSAYNGISTSPLFVFGRAVFLGMTSKGNTGTCRYAYPQCPTDPEQLIFYLNNHNGGFFRFFSAPQLQNQNVEQFYNQLSQGYDLQRPYTGQSSYGYPSDPNSSQHYGFYPNTQYQEYPRPGAYDSQYNTQNYGSQRPGSYDNPSLYNNQMYGPNYAYDYNNYGSGNPYRFKDNNARIEKRIQNTPTQNFANDSFEDDDVKTKWQFPNDQYENLNNNEYGIRDIRTLKFPGEDQSYNNYKDSNRKVKRLHFPTDQNYENYDSNRQQFSTNNNRYQSTTYSYSNGQDNNNNYNNNQQYYTNDRYQTTTYSYNNGHNNQNYYSNRPIAYTNNNNYKNPATKYYNYNYDPNLNDNNYQNNHNYYNNRQNIYNNNYKYPSTTYNNEEYVFDHKHNFYVKKENNNYLSHVNNFKRKEVDDGSKTVYVIRGNGDPNRPEVVQLRPGQSVY